MSNITRKITRNQLKDLYIQQCKEIERLNNIINELKERSLQYSEEIDRLLDIKEKVREYIMTELISEWDIENDGYVSGSDLPVDAITLILEILDKGE